MVVIPVVCMGVVSKVWSVYTCLPAIEMRVTDHLLSFTPLSLLALHTLCATPSPPTRPLSKVCAACQTFTVV